MAIYKDVSSLEVVGYTEPKNGTFSDGVQFVLEKLDAIPEADVAPIVHAHWIYPYEHTCHDDDIAQCSNCGSYFQDKINNIGLYHKWCPHCSAKMDEEVK